jgi:carbon-monoxide dehydrogenase large subunit
VAILRSPYAHARIRSIDTTRAERLSGVVFVITGQEVKANMNLIPEAYDTRAMGAKGVAWYSLCPEWARFVGEAVAAVVAEDRYTAYAALDLIDINYEGLPAATDPEEAMKPGAPLVEPGWGDNILVTRDFRTGDPDKAFSEADGTVSGVVQSNRITGASIEPRGCVASYDPYKNALTFWDSTQDPHPLRVYLAQTLRISENTIRLLHSRSGSFRPATSRRKAQPERGGGAPRNRW